MHLDIQTNPNIIERITEEVIHNLSDARIHLVVSHGIHGLLMNFMKKELNNLSIKNDRINFDTIGLGGGTRIRFINFKEALKVKDCENVNVYVCDHTFRDNCRKFHAMMELFKSWRKFRSFYSIIDCSLLFDGITDEIVKMNDGNYDMHIDEKECDEIIGDFAICRHCGKCLGKNRTICWFSGQEKSASYYDSDEPLNNCGRIIKIANDASICLEDIVVGKFKNTPSSIQLLINKSCPYYAEHMLSEMKH